MTFSRQHHLVKSCTHRGWSWLAAVLALVGTVLPLTGWNASSQLQNLLVSEHSAEGQKECSGEDDKDDSVDGDLDLHFLVRRLRETLPPQMCGWGVPIVMPSRNASAALVRDGRSAAEFNAAPLPLRC